MNCIRCGEWRTNEVFAQFCSPQCAEATYEQSQRDLAAAQARTSRLNEQLRDERVMRNGLADEMTSLIEERDAAQARVAELEQQYLDMASLSLTHEHLADAARAEARALRNTLRLLEWIEGDSDSPKCWNCGCSKTQGHGSHCFIGQALAAATPAPGGRK